MPYSTLISAAAMADRYLDPEWAVIDCRFALASPELGRRQYLRAHIPGAFYAHLEQDLSGPIIPGKTGRHPLPSQESVEALFSSWGIEPGTQVVAYDDSGGSMAARLWWMLRWQGHDAAALLDGGWQAWLKAGLPVRKGEETRPAGRFIPDPRPSMIAETAEIEEAISTRALILVDARAPERYRGENETIDPVAGRIPGALNAPHESTLDDEGRFRTAEALRRRFERILSGESPQHAVFYCGSGVSAGQDLLAMEIAGLTGARLYPGSWSEWITDPDRPIETGTERKEEKSPDDR